MTPENARTPRATAVANVPAAGSTLIYQLAKFNQPG
jgi:hypothetical protein